MDEMRKIHLLSQELIPVIDDLDAEPKQIVLEHIQECDDCKGLYSQLGNFEQNFPQPNYPNEVEIKPLKKLVQFNTGLKLLLIAVRAVILFYIFYSSFKYFGLESKEIILSTFQGAIFFFYLPAAVFLLVFTFTFFNKKWVWISLMVDLIVILFLGKILQLFL